MLSFDITDRNIRIIKGTESGNKIRISSAATLELDEDIIVNGYVQDIPRVATLINSVLATNRMADKEAIVAEKMFSGLVEGRISKQLKEICLLDQVYVKAEDGKQTVAQYLTSVNKELSIAKVVRFEVGEGMEKKNEDFAAEVAAQLG